MDPTTHETPYGAVTIGPNYVSVKADGSQLWAWSHRPGSHWPCSTLEDLDSISIGFDMNGLVDLEQSPAHASSSYVGEVECNEMNAWTSDAIGAVLAGDHPCWFVVVGQFVEREDWPASAVSTWPVTTTKRR